MIFVCEINLLPRLGKARSERRKAFFASQKAALTRPIITPCQAVSISASASQVVTSASVGIRPAQTSFSLITRPGVARIG